MRINHKKYVFTMKNTENYAKIAENMQMKKVPGHKCIRLIVYLFGMWPTMIATARNSILFGSAWRQEGKAATQAIALRRRNVCLKHIFKIILNLFRIENYLLNNIYLK